MHALKTKSNIGEMFNIQYKENGEIAISARELYKALEVKKRFSACAEIILKHFLENSDFTSVSTS
ncbi:antA/AntB antirepressor family protein, partial [Staphylococcus aureus]|uniref:antA/AntB antirepressor family protein n=1 Tax=Staphylococcus aureus TaxID=1280 RepID=UPI00403FD1BB